jgi:hypothetical protein
MGSSTLVQWMLAVLSADISHPAAALNTSGVRRGFLSLLNLSGMS